MAGRVRRQATGVGARHPPLLGMMLMQVMVAALVFLFRVVAWGVQASRRWLVSRGQGRAAAVAL